ncbi:MAG: helix-turn-helix transcriptional regulator [Oscillospiraceae bacterium]|nr:helix-turn-helix transcriptional regulator [Oscillospiraceae bacterium]
MQLILGTKIRELRQRDGRTQDTLAEALGITAQAVSRWESGGSYPDMEMIPAIANYFHVSIDELFGYHDKREEKIKTILEKATKILTKQGFTMYQGSLTEDVEECVNMLRAASEEFPNEPKILLKLAQALHMWGWNKYGAKGHFDDSCGIIEDDTQYNSQNIYWQEAVRVYEKLLRSNPSSEDREIAIRQITPLYCRMGAYEKAKALANDQNALVICKEVLLPLATVGEEKARYQGERMMALLSNLHFAVSESVALRPAVSASEYGRKILLSVINVYETIFIDGKCGRWHWEIGSMYLTLAGYEMDNSGSTEKILYYFDKGFDHCEEYRRIYNESEYQYTAPLISNLPHIVKGDLAPIGDDFWKKELKNYQKNIVDEIHNNPKYSKCFE